MSKFEKIIHFTVSPSEKTNFKTAIYKIPGLALKMQFLLLIHPHKRILMKKSFTLIILILLLITGAEEAFGENILNHPGKLDIKFIDFLSADFKYVYNPVDTLNQASQIWKLKLGNRQGIENRERPGTKPILTLGSIPEVLLKYQSDTVLQWGYNLHDLVLSLRIGVRAEDFNYIDFQVRQESNNILDLNLNFSFLIDFWFK